MAASRPTLWDDGAAVSHATEDDGTSAERSRARLEGWDTAGLTWRRVGVDANGALKLAANVSVDLGSVDQGAGGSSAWKVDGSAVTQPVSATSLPLPTGAAKDSTLTDGTQRVGGTVAVSGTFFQGTQPVSAASLPLPSGAATDATLTNGNLRVGGSVAVTGTFFQATQPVSLATAPTTPVTGTFWQATQPVSGTFWQATQPVSGAFFQATQPVSIASMPSTPVTGTFWQATQPVSGTFWQTTQPVSLASNPLPTGAAIEVGGFLQQHAELLQQLLIETRIHSLLLGQGLNVGDDVGLLRSDPSFLN